MQDRQAKLLFVRYIFLAKREGRTKTRSGNSVEKRPKADVLLVRSLAALVYKKCFTWVKKLDKMPWLTDCL